MPVRTIQNTSEVKRKETIPRT